VSLISVAQARSRGIALPADDDVAQDIIDEQEAWLARRIGLLTGSRTETFYVGVGETRGKLGLARYTDDVTLTDGNVAVDADTIRLVDRGAGVVRAYAAATRWWTGPYVAATYEPNDQLLVESALYDLVALKLQPVTGFTSEQMGAYSYQKGTGATSLEGQRRAIAASLLPKHDQAVTLRGPRRLGWTDPVINRPEPVDA
jgi:hypothetical protein